VSERDSGRRRRRRSDAERSSAAVLDAAVRVLGRDPDATVEQVAAAAGVARQTVYAHYPSRPLLLAAVVDRITAESIAALDAAEADCGTATEALLRWLDVTWLLFDRYPLLRHPAAAGDDRADPDRRDARTIGGDRADPDRRHVAVNARLERLIRRGQDAGEFDGAADPGWLVSATVALGHAAGAEVAAGRLTTAQAAAALRRSVLRMYRAGEP